MIESARNLSGRGPVGGGGFGSLALQL
jgi:hypothetical protein